MSLKTPQIGWNLYRVKQNNWILCNLQNWVYIKNFTCIHKDSWDLWALQSTHKLRFWVVTVHLFSKQHKICWEVLINDILLTLYIHNHISANKNTLNRNQTKNKFLKPLATTTRFKLAYRLPFSDWHVFGIQGVQHWFWALTGLVCHLYQYCRPAVTCC